MIKPSIIYKNVLSEKRFKKHRKNNNDSNEYIAPFSKEIVGSTVADSLTAQGTTASQNGSSTYQGITTSQNVGSTDLAPYADNSTDPETASYFPSIGDQGYEGSCACFSTCYYLGTYEAARAWNILLIIINRTYFHQRGHIT